MDQKKQRLIQKLEAIGPVNLEALEEYNREKERVQFLINQSHDLDDSEKTLIETINKINHTAHERFVQTFQLVKDNFKSVFGSFFGEGEADLQIVETDDPINSKIEVFAHGSEKGSVHSASFGRREIADGVSYTACHLQSETESVLYPGRSRCAFGRCKYFQVYCHAEKIFL